MKKFFFFVFLFVTYSTFGQKNYVSNFNGSSSYIDLGSGISTGVRSVAFYFSPNVDITSGLSSTMTFLMRNDAIEAAEWGVFIGAYPLISSTYNGKICFYTRIGDVIQCAYSNSSTWAAGQWYYVCATIDATTGMNLYIDGVLQSTNPAITAAIPARSETLCLGTWGDSHIRYLNGRMEELSLWNRTLTLSEILSQQCVPLNTFLQTGLVAYYKFDEGSGSYINNELAGFDGTVAGSGWIDDTTCVDYASVSEINQEQNALIIYPNPANDKITIEVKQETLIDILNVQGQIVLQQLIQQGKAEISISELASGVYFLRQVNANQPVLTRIIKE